MLGIFWIVEYHGLNSLFIITKIVTFLYGLHCDIQCFRHNEDSLVGSVGDHHDKSCTSPDFRSRSFVHQAQEVFPGRRVLVIICNFFDVSLMTLFSTYFRVVSFVALDLLLFSLNLHGAFGGIWNAGVYCLIILDTIGYRTFCVKWQSNTLDPHTSPGTRRSNNLTRIDVMSRRFDVQP